MFNKYFQDELVYLRELGREFAQAYPALAPMLADRGGDPDVERLLEGVAFLTGRIRQKLDDELPEFLQSLGLLLFPHLMRPLPSTSMLEITPVANALRETHVVKAGTEFASVPVDGVTCMFQSSMDCALAPIGIEDVRLEPLPGGRQQIAITIRSLTGSPLANVMPPSIRLHFAGEPHIAFAVLFAVNRQLTDVTLSPVHGKGASRELSLGTKVLRWVGFEEDEGLLPLGRHVFPGFRLLEEYYVMPSKFAFVDIGDVRRVVELDKEATRVTLGLRLERAFPPTLRVTTQNIKLHCVPIVNVFETTAEPIRLTPERERFLVRPAGLPPAHGEVYAIQHVQAILRGSTQRVTIPAFYEFSHTTEGDHGFYTTHVSPSVTGDGADVLVSFGSPEGSSNRMVDAETISLDLLATNRSTPTALRPGDVSVHTPSSPAFVTFSNILAMTPHVSMPLGRDLQWRAVAHAAIGLRALTEPEVLRAVIDVYNLHAIVDRAAARANEMRVAAMQATCASRPEERLHRGAAVRGVAIDIDLDEDGFAGDGDLFLFSAVLDRMLGEHVSINSFAHTTFRTLRSKLELRWPPPQRQHDDLVALLQGEGRRFGFFQAVQLMHRLIPNTTPVGELGPPDTEPVRFKHDPDLIFQPGDIARVEIIEKKGGGLRAVMTTTFLGLTGTASPLATVFAEEVLRAEAQEETSLGAFYDLFHHRLVSLFYRTWKKYRFEAGFRADASDAFSRRMLTFVGVDMAGAVPTRGLTPLQILGLAPLASSRTRPARTLQIVLERFLPGVKVGIDQFVLRRVQVRDDDRCLVGKQNNVLDANFTIGRTVADRSGRFRIVVGPVDYPTFESLMPGGRQHAQLRNVIYQFVPAHLEPELELILGTENAPQFQLAGERGSRLGVTTHLPMKKNKGMRARVVLSESVTEAVPHLYPEGQAPEEGATAVVLG